MSISYQLYSARNFTPWESIIEKLAAMGYKNVEGFGGNYGDPSAFRALIDQHGIAMPSAHFFPIDNFEGDLEKTLSTAKTLGVKRLFCPAPTDEYRNGTTSAKWIELAKRLEEAGKKVNDAGFAFGWHNHHWEFMPLADGAIAMELLLEHAPSIDWEMDVAWVVRGGADPMDWISRHADRITTAHVKDIAPEGEAVDEDGWADVGHGMMGWAEIYKKLKGVGVDLFVIEHDNPNDFDRFSKRSIEFMRGLGA